jgi:D-xylonolactonase
MPAFQHIDGPNCLLGENPVWYPPTGEFFWTDILRGTIFAFSPEAAKVRVVLRTPYQTGAFLVDSEGGLILFTEHGVFGAARDGDGFMLERTPRWKLPFVDGERFNDAIADPAGNVISGSKRADNTQGRLYRFSKGKEPEVLLENLGISNGMGFSPDGVTFYHTDSVPSVITAYDYSPDSALSNPRTLIRLNTSVDPDGMTVDQQGNIWFVCWGAGTVQVISPKGAFLRQYRLGAKQCSSICFGGDSLSDAFVTSASIGGTPGGELGGDCFYARSSGVGKPEYLANPLSI